MSASSLELKFYWMGTSRKLASTIKKLLLMSLVAHRFARVEFWIIVIVFIRQAQFKKSKQIQYARHHNPLLITNCSWILTLHKGRTFLTFKMWVKNIKTAGYNGARTVFETQHVQNWWATKDIKKKSFGLIWLKFTSYCCHRGLASFLLDFWCPNWHSRH